MTARFASPLVRGQQAAMARAGQPKCLTTSISRSNVRGALAAASLRTLPEGWFVMHDVPWPGRAHVTIDHVVIGPAGVFVVDDKAWSGEIGLDFTALRHNGLRRDSVISSAVEATHAIVRSSPHASPGHVRAMLCFAPGSIITGRSSQVEALTADEIASWLVVQPRVLSSREVVQIVVELEDVLSPVAGVGHAEERDVNVPTVATAARRYPMLPATRWELTWVLLALAAFLLLITQPMLLMSLPGHLRSWVGGAS